MSRTWPSLLIYSTRPRNPSSTCNSLPSDGNCDKHGFTKQYHGYEKEGKKTILVNNTATEHKMMKANYRYLNKYSQLNCLI